MLRKLSLVMNQLCGCHRGASRHSIVSRGFASKSIEIKSEEQFRDVVLKGPTPCLVDFYADWCGPCKVLYPRIRQAVDVHGEKILELAKVNIDNLEDLAAQYEIQSLPTVKLFNNGAVISEFIGQRTQDQMDHIVKDYVAQLKKLMMTARASENSLNGTQPSSNAPSKKATGKQSANSMGVRSRPSYHSLGASSMGPVSTTGSLSNASNNNGLINRQGKVIQKKVNPKRVAHLRMRGSSIMTSKETTPQPELATLGEINERADFKKEVLEAAHPTIVIFTAEWCDSCKKLTPLVREVLGKLASDGGNKTIKAFQLDVDKNEEIADEYDITGVPSIKGFHKGKQQWAIRGLRPKAELETIFKSF